VRRSTEEARVALLRAAFARDDPRVRLGIGDDAAVLEPSPEALVWTVDAAVAGVHFRTDFLSRSELGYRATMTAASDVAAMGGDPIAVLSSLVLPADFDDAELSELAAGQRDAADELGAVVVGGNLARGSELSVTTTLVGRASRPLRRDGARPGDEIHVAGELGMAAAGLSALLRGVRPPELAEALRAWRRPRARVAEGIAASGVATAAIDASDGLACDIGHVAEASGARAVLDESALIEGPLQDAARALGLDPLELALYGGEDYALLVALPPGKSVAGFRPIGAFVPGDGVWLRRIDGRVTPIEARGFDHFAPTP
jgi:thiamine-monophosphate kinase